jgi:hypothetical protein
MPFVKPAMRKVVDSNFMRSPKLSAYLAVNPNNRIIISDYAGVEAHTGSTLVTVAESMAIPARFPRQVIVLKSTYTICGLRGIGKGLQKRLIDEHSTRSFSKYCKQLVAAKSGDQSVQTQLLANGKAAVDVLNSIEAAVPKFTGAISLIASKFTPQERRQIRERETFPRALINKLVNQVLDTAVIIFANDPRTQSLPDYDTLLNRYTFRYTLCGQLLTLLWGAQGGASGARLATVRNDLIDLHFATCATYFDGLLSGDLKTQSIYRRAVHILNLMKAA